MQLKNEGGVAFACYNLVYYFTIRMEIGYKEAPIWRFSGVRKFMAVRPF